MGFVKKQLLKLLSVWKKNLNNHLSNKKKIIGELLFPSIISLIYYQYRCKFSLIQKVKNNLLSKLWESYLCFIWPLFQALLSGRLLLCLSLKDSNDLDSTKWFLDCLTRFTQLQICLIWTHTPSSSCCHFLSLSMFTIFLGFISLTLSL